MPSGQPAGRRRYDDLTLMPTAQTDITALDISRVRSQFPSLSQTVDGQPAVFLDGPGGTQVPQRVIDAISDYLKTLERQHPWRLRHQSAHRRCHRRSSRSHGGFFWL